jgi:hypothetical protein
MTKPLRQSIEILVGDSSVAIDVTFRIIEVIERHYDMRAELVGKLILENDARIKRTDVARVMVSWFDAAKVEFPRDDLFEAVLTAPDASLRKYIGAIQGAIWYSLKEITADELKALARGENIRQEGDDAGGTKKNETTD